DKESTGLCSTDLNSITFFYSMDCQDKESTGLCSTDLNSISFFYSMDCQDKDSTDTHLSIGRGRGRGRGLKSLTSKGKFSTKSSLFQSSDLVKKYIQEVETSKLLNVCGVLNCIYIHIFYQFIDECYFSTGAIEKGQQQQLANVPMSSSHEREQ
ncbi:hypothetical protein H5410_005030, partial [Solanum commersonii]